MWFIDSTQILVFPDFHGCREIQYLCGVDKVHVICCVAEVSSFFLLESFQWEKRDTLAMQQITCTLSDSAQIIAQIYFVCSYLSLTFTLTHTDVQDMNEHYDRCSLMSTSPLFIMA